MKFIDKSINQTQGHSLVNNFLTSRWNNGYSFIHYPTKNRPNSNWNTLKLPLKQLLLHEQENLCCYCMRIIDENSTTFEHIIPKSITTQNELNQYTHFQILKDNVCLQSVFENATIQLNTPPFPLEIAYENLTASCNGRLIDGIPRDTTAKFCNNFRGNKFVEPLFYLNNISTEIEYKKGGLLVPQNAIYDESINNVKLNYQTLQKIRQVWYYISVENLVNIENATTENERNTILTLNLISLSQNERTSLIANFKTQTFWNILLEYKWFYEYYRNQYLISTR